MTTRENKRLRFRRQFILSPAKIDFPFLHKSIKISKNYYLFFHPDLHCTIFENQNKKLILLGNIFDFDKPFTTNSGILEDLFPLSFDAIVEKSARYCGRFVLIFAAANEFKIFHDATAAREIFYAIQNDKLWIASQSHLLAKILSLGPTTNPYKQNYFQSDDFVKMCYSNVCDSTYYDETIQLMHNAIALA